MSVPIQISCSLYQYFLDCLFTSTNMRHYLFFDNNIPIWEQFMREKGRCIKSSSPQYNKSAIIRRLLLGWLLLSVTFGVGPLTFWWDLVKTDRDYKTNINCYTSWNHVWSAPLFPNKIFSCWDNTAYYMQNIMFLIMTVWSGQKRETEKRQRETKCY